MAQLVGAGEQPLGFCQPIVDVDKGLAVAAAVIPADGTQWLFYHNDLPLAGNGKRIPRFILPYQLGNDIAQKASPQSLRYFLGVNFCLASCLPIKS